AAAPLRVLPHPRPGRKAAVRRGSDAARRQAASRRLSPRPRNRAQTCRRGAVPAVRAADRQGLGEIGAPHILREYALVADGERGAVVGPRGDFTWMCFPRWDSDGCFATLIGGQGTY